MKERVLLILKRIKNFSFYKKKIFYIVLTVLFSLLLLADVAVAIFVPAQSRGFGGRGMQNEFFQMEAMPDDKSEANEDSEMTMPEGTQRPEMWSDSERPEMPDDMEMPEFGGMAQTTPGFLQVVKSHWLILFVVLAVLDGFSIFMLIYISGKEKKQKIQELQELTEAGKELAPVRKPVKKEKHNQFAGLIVLGAMLLLVIVVKVLTSQSGEETARTEATVYSGTAETGEISSVLPGTGTLAEETAIALELPAGVEITKWYVANGDTVQEGDKLAQVDSVSVMSVIVAVQEKMVALDEELEEHENEEISDKITAGAPGRVKAIFAQKDIGVVETMYESGALMLISLDGMMAVSLETDAELSAGDTVKVVLSDSTEINGKVESVIDGTAVVTVSDEETDYGELVTVTMEDGAEVGTGELYIHSELKVTGFTGTVSDVEVAVEEEVSSGEALLTLTDTDYTGEYELLLEQRAELEAQMQELFQLYQEQYVYASCTGVVSGIDEALISVAEGSEMTYRSTTTTATNRQSGGFMTMSYTSTGTRGGMKMMTTDVATEPEFMIQPQNVSDTESGTTPDAGSGTTPDTGSGTVPDQGSGTTPDTGSGTTPDAGSGTTPDTGSGTTPDTGNGTVPDTGNGTTPDTGTAYTNYIGTVIAAQNNGDTIIIELASVNGSGTNKLTIPASQYVYAFMNSKYVAGTAADIQVNDTMMLVYASGSTSPAFCIRIAGANGSGMSGTTEKPEDSADDQSSMSQGTLGQQASGGAMPSADAQNQSAYTEVMGTLEEEIQKDYGIDMTTWLSVTPQEKMEIIITVDEMDILSLEEGQEALVTLDAFPGQSFQGTVTNVYLNGTNSGGSSKYEAVVSIEREENMLAGMNASVQITIDTKENVLLIPEAALIEHESGVYVYTSYDEKTETFGDMTEVTTGASDGENVEILSGLSEGSEYWYSYLDVVNYATYFASNRGGFSMGFMFGGNGAR